VTALWGVDPGNATPVPVDLVTASGSGLDPHISVAAALYQAARVARVRQVPQETVRRLIERHTEGRQFGILGEPRVNVLELNLDLDRTR
jgi:K+-transporting ATPase ATPase C chain